MNSDLKKHLAAYKESLTGYWIEKNSSYDGDICKILRMTPGKCRYWDAEWNGLLL